jgi:hypothetical protein
VVVTFVAAVTAAASAISFCAFATLIAATSPDAIAVFNAAAFATTFASAAVFAVTAAVAAVAAAVEAVASAAASVRAALVSAAVLAV